MAYRATKVFGILLGSFLFIANCSEPRQPPEVSSNTESHMLEVTLNNFGPTKLDLLFVVDNSQSMGEEQARLIQHIDLLIRELLNPTDGQSAIPIEDLHVGIISTDLGTTGFEIPRCSNASFGDHGILQNVGRLDGCAHVYRADSCSDGECPWLDHSADHPDDGRDGTNPPIWEDFGCIAALGIDGCGFEQQLEASLVALTLQAGEGRPNEGFLREDSLLAIVYVTDEDDCSAGDTEMFDTQSDLGNINVRCALPENQDRLYPISRYVEGFRNLRPNRENDVIVAGIVGIPIDGSWYPGDDLQLLRNMQQVDPENPNQLIRSCQSEYDLEGAYPPVRIAELIYQFGNDGVLESICPRDWSLAMATIRRKIQSKLLSSCLDVPVSSLNSGVCRVIETLPGDAPCSDLADISHESDQHLRTQGSRFDLGLDELGRRRCLILSTDYDDDGCPDGAANCAAGDFSGRYQGWWYDTSSPGCQLGKIMLTDDADPNFGSQLVLSCRVTTCSERRRCPEAALYAPECTIRDPWSCPGDQVCITHASADICGSTHTTSIDGTSVLLPNICAHCSGTVGQHCPFIQDNSSPEISARPIISPGGCCAEGFYCDQGRCVAEPSTQCY